MTALLTRIEPDRNMARFYRVEVTADLFGGRQIIRHWGRVGTHGQSLHRWCATEAEAQGLTQALLAAKLRRGYSPAD
ncbi:WGR domain-containing protein [uncultured Paracoccus sp.]|uniref:WGR domain-containing protein n=1 Tax=uncultured Paracoccus sp. TaxID=189685 RepID=UPI00262133EA|nr:WGR domain-containing protein [uncultured Paracoccus sp.]